jgi:hypothetical protein
MISQFSRQDAKAQRLDKKDFLAALREMKTSKTISKYLLLRVTSRP